MHWQVSYTQYLIVFALNQYRLIVYNRNLCFDFRNEETCAMVCKSLSWIFKIINQLNFFIYQRGLAQIYILSCIPCRRSFTRNFAKKYVSSAGIPLVEKVNKRPEPSSLEERVQILESLLRDYYLDDY